MTQKVPRNVDELAETLRVLHEAREDAKSETKTRSRPRRALHTSDRQRVLEKTGRRCHICGGRIEGRWHADHVLAYSGGGEHSVDNYLPAHELCNNYRWDYSAQEFQYILKLGVWTRTQIEKQTRVGREVAEGFLRHEQSRERRRKRK